MVSLQEFVWKAHKGQMRKHNSEPYFHHLIRVKAMSLFYYDICSPRDCGGERRLITEASLGHDLLEDTEVTRQDLADERFLERSIGVIVELTNVFEKADYPDHNRKQRKEMEFDRLSNVSWPAKLIKTCDRIDNMSMRFHEPGHWKKNYKPETLDLFDAIFPIKDKEFKKLEKIARKMIK